MQVTATPCIDFTDLHKIPDLELVELIKTASRIQRCNCAWDQLFPALKNAWLDGAIWAINYAKTNCRKENECK